LPTTATHKTLKRQLIAEGPVAGDGMLWIREPRGTAYRESTSRIRG
jgi:fatty-acyl-CoA synthase